MTQTFKEDMEYILKDYNNGTTNEKDTIEKSMNKLKHHLISLKKEPGMCARTLNRAIEICSGDNVPE